MDILRILFPLSFSVRELRSLLISVGIYLVIGIVAGVICKIVGIIPILGALVAWLIGAVAGLYVLVGIVLSVLTFLAASKR